MAVNFQNDKPKLVVLIIMSLTQLKLLYEKILLAISGEGAWKETAFGLRWLALSGPINRVI